MNPIQHHFAEGQVLFANQKYAQAYQQFEYCTNMMPDLSAAWENMAVCLANQGYSSEHITNRLLSIAPSSVHSSLVSKINGLHSTIPYQLHLQNFELSKAVESFSLEWTHGRVSEDIAIHFLRCLFLAHEHLAKKRGHMHVPKLLNQWKDHPALQYCMDIISQHVQELLSNHTAQMPMSKAEIELIETLGLIHYTYTNYAEAAVCFQILQGTTIQPVKQLEYKSHLSTCYSLNAQYKEALDIDDRNITAWERYAPTSPRAFRAQALKLIRSARQIHRHCLPYWPAHTVRHKNEEIVIAQLQHASICGHDPMVFDEEFVYAGNRGTFRLAQPNEPIDINNSTGMVIFSTNPNNHYHLLIEFCSKLLAAECSGELPKDIPVFIPTANIDRVRSMTELLGIERPIIAFSIYEHLSFNTLYVIDVTQPGHYSTKPKNLWDCYLPHQKSIKRLVERFKSASPAHDTQNLFIYTKRSGGARSFDDPHNQVDDLLLNWAIKQGLEFVMFDGTIPLSEQIELFGQCHTLFGIHGAGLTNILFTNHCNIVEIPIHGNCNPLFQELSIVTNDRHIICDLSCEYQGTITVNNEVLNSIENALKKTILP